MSSKEDQNGGAVLGRGGYGCAIKPSAICDLPEIPANKTRVSKIMSEQDAFEEMEEYKIIKKIDPSNKFTLKPPTLCYMIKEEQSAETKRDIKTCSIKDRSTGEILQQTRLNALLMENGGNSIGSISPSYLTRIVKKKGNTRANFFRQLRRCFYGIDAINKAGKYHNDIKPDNILIKDDGTDEFNIIDFGLMRNLDKAFIIGRSYFAYPWTNMILNPDNGYASSIHNYHTIKDAKLWRYMAGDIRNYYTSNDYTGSFYQKYIHPYYKDKNRLDTVVEQSYQYFVSRFNKSHSIKQIERICQRDYTNKLDVYSLGITILYLITKIDNRKDKSKLPSYLKDLVNICLRMININVMERYSTKEALAEYDKYLVKHGFVKKPKNATATHSEKQPTNKKYKRAPESPLYDNMSCVGKTKENCKGPNCIFTNGKVRKYCRRSNRVKRRNKTRKTKTPPSKTKSLSLNSTRNSKTICKGKPQKDCDPSKCLYVNGKKRQYCRRKTRKQK